MNKKAHSEEIQIPRKRSGCGNYLPVHQPQVGLPATGGRQAESSHLEALGASKQIAPGEARGSGITAKIVASAR